MGPHGDVILGADLRRGRVLTRGFANALFAPGDDAAAAAWWPRGDGAAARFALSGVDGAHASFAVTRVTAWIVPRPRGARVAREDISWMWRTLGFPPRDLRNRDDVDVVFDTAPLAASSRARNHTWTNEFHDACDGLLRTPEGAPTGKNLLIVAW